MQGAEQHLRFTRREDWRAWLAENGQSAKAVWLLHYKKGFGPPERMSYEESVEEALCFGWIDGLMHPHDAESYAIRYSPRKPKSIWAASNKQRVQKLIAEGRMTPAGLALVAQAKANGQWEAAAQRDNVELLPADLEESLKTAGALAAYRALSPSRKKQYAYWIADAKRAETRQKRIAATVEAVAAGKRLW